jgi:hypothetical protein
MIYIGYRVEEDVVYKTLNGNKFHLVSYYSDSTWRNVGRIVFTLETDEKDKFTFDYLFQKENNDRWSKIEYKHLHYFMITCTDQSDNDICIKNDISMDDEETWCAFLDWVDTLISPIKDFMKKRSQEMDAVKNIQKDFAD